MALTIIAYDERAGRLISKERLYLTDEGEVVRAGDPRASSLLVGAGCEVDEATAKRYGLEVIRPEEPEPEPEPLKPAEEVWMNPSTEEPEGDVSRETGEAVDETKSDGGEGETFAQRMARLRAEKKAQQEAEENKSLPGPPETK